MKLQNIRRGLRGDSVVLMGKNTMMKRTIRIHAEKTGNTAILNLIPLLVGNVGLIFTKGDLKDLADPTKFAAVAAPVAAAAESGSAPAANVEEKKDEPEKESDEDMGLGLFD